MPELKTSKLLKSQPGRGLLLHGLEAMEGRYISAEREIPVHPDLIKLGFLEFVAASSGERLFIDPSCRRSRSDVTGLTASAGRRIAC
jgi:hypothetical protein